MDDKLDKMLDHEIVSDIMAARLQINRFLKEVKTEWATIHQMGDFVALVVYERNLCALAKTRGIRIAAWEIGGP